MPAFDWKKYRTLAERWKCYDNDEYKRSSISRAYYAIYHLLKLKRGHTSDDYKKHDWLVTEYKNSENKFEQEIGDCFQRLKEERTDADYKAWADFPKWRINEFWKDIEEVLNLLEQKEEEDTFQI